MASSVARREHEPVADEHVVGVELLGQDDLHPVAEVAERLPRDLVGAVEHEQHARRRARPRCAGRARRARRSRPWCAGRRSAHSSTTRTLLLGGAVRQRAERARGAPSSSGSAAGSERGFGPWATPPPRHCGARIEPWRARPVPFWRHGLAPPPATSARVLVLCVPARAAASCAVTTWCMTATFGSMPNTASGRSTEPPSAPVCGLHRRRALTSRPPSRASRTNTRPPFGPGTEPRTRSRLRSASPSTTSRFSVVVRTLPVLAGHLHALEHACRRGARADRARGAVLLVVAVRRALALEVVALHRAGEALALRDAGDVDPVALGEHVDHDRLADREVGEVVDPQLDEVLRRLDAGLLRGDRARACSAGSALVSPKASCTAA